MVTNMNKREKQMKKRANTSGLNLPYIKRTDPELNISVLPRPQSEKQSVEYDLCFKTHFCFPIHILTHLQHVLGPPSQQTLLCVLSNIYKHVLTHLILIITLW